MLLTSSSTRRDHFFHGRVPFAAREIGAARPLDIEHWRSYFDGISARMAAIDVVGRAHELDGRVRAMQLRAISFDPDRAVLELELGIKGAVLRHFISEPREIHVAAPGADGSTEILVHDASGTHTRIRLSGQPDDHGEAPATPIETTQGHAHSSPSFRGAPRRPRGRHAS